MGGNRQLTCDSEEQQPLENFFRAKGIKTKNEMADDVSSRVPGMATSTNAAMCSREPSLRQRSKMRIWRRATTERRRTGVVPTRMTRALTRTLRRTLSPRLARSLTLTIKAAAPTVMQTWRMRRVTGRRRKRCQNGRRRSRRCRNSEDRTGSTRRHGWACVGR